MSGVPGSCSTKAIGLAISDGEVNFLWSFIQGGILIPETWDALVRGFGFCERHAWLHMSVEMSFRKEHLLGPVILYRELIDKSARTVDPIPSISLSSFIRRLRGVGPCFLCSLNIDQAASGASSRARLDRGRNTGNLRAHAAELRPFWAARLCGICATEEGQACLPGRCRRHLLTEIETQKSPNLISQQRALGELSMQLTQYEKSFAAGSEEPNAQIRASLISAVGWCSGWRPLLALLE